jgi:predicted MPP superfamily phosphohydrolase
VAWLASSAYIALGLIFSIPRLANLIHSNFWWSWLRGGAFLWGMAISLLFVVALLWRVSWRWRPAPFQQDRRRFLQVAQGAMLASPVAMTGFGVWVARTQFELREVELPVADLHPDLEGLRLVQLSDIHLSPFLSEYDLAKAVDVANETRAHVALVTGDLITGPGDPVDDCLRQLARLKADAGVFGCMGNHEVYADTIEYTELEAGRLGIPFLRSSNRELKFGNARLNLAGVDYQRMGSNYLVGAEALVKPGMCNVLLSHNPDVIPVAAAKGFDVTLAGHTHGGQVTVEILSQYLNIARFFTRFVYGRYGEGGKAAYVTRGIGTVGVPARIGAPPEVALIRLVKARPATVRTTHPNRFA